MLGRPWVLSVVWSLLCAGQAQAQPRHRLKLNAGGQVLGLPAAFDQVSLRGLGAGERGAIAVHIGARTITLPPCLSRLFRELSAARVRAYASWDREGNGQPYLSIELPRTAVDGATVEDARMLFDLAHATLLEVHAKRGAVPVELDELCSVAEQRQLAPSGGKETTPLGIEEPWAERASVMVEATYVADQLRGYADEHPLLRVDRVQKGELGSSRIVFDGLDPLPNEVMPAELKRGRRYRIYLAPTEETRARNAHLPARRLPAFYPADTIAVVDLDRTTGEENARRAQLARWRGLEAYQLTAAKWRSLRSRRALDYDEVARVFHALQKLVLDFGDAEDARALLGTPDEREATRDGVRETYYLNPRARKDPAQGEVVARVELYYASRYGFAPLRYAEQFQVFHGNAFEDGPHDELRARGVEWVTIVLHPTPPQD